jgi:hypothetical protein
MRSMRKDVREIVIVAATPMLLAACWDPDEPCGDENCEAIASNLIAPCESFGCGGNASIGRTLVRELNANGLPNEEGFVLEGFTSGDGAAHRMPIGTPMKLDVQDDRLLGLVSGQPTIEGVELVGARLHLRLPSGMYVFMRLGQMRATNFWSSPGTGQVAINIYEVVEDGPNGKELCDSALSGQVTPDGAIERPTNMAVVFAGDRYDSHRGLVEVPGDPGWLNIACVGTALAKMHFLRHTSAGSGSTTSPSRVNRQAMLKLLSADYCGDGRAYSRNGNPLFFQDPDGLFDPSPWWGSRVAEFEAIWTAAGALCLDDPRRWDPTQSYGQLRAEIVSACENSPAESFRRTIPRCTAEQLASWRSWGPISRNVNP